MIKAIRCVVLTTLVSLTACASQPRVEPKPIIQETGDLFKSENVDKIVKGMPKQKALDLIGVPPMMILPSAGVETYSWGKTSQRMMYNGVRFRPYRGEFPTSETLVISFRNGKVDQKVYNKHQMQSQIRKD